MSGPPERRLTTGGGRPAGAAPGAPALRSTLSAMSGAKVSERVGTRNGSLAFNPVAPARAPGAATTAAIAAQIIAQRDAAAQAAAAQPAGAHAGRPRLQSTTLPNGRPSGISLTSINTSQGEGVFEVDGVRVRFAVLTHPGSEPGGYVKQNQDSYVIHEKLLGFPNIAMLGVMDGHGHYGRVVSQHVVQALPSSLGQCSSFRAGEMEEAFRIAFPATNRSLVARRDVDCDLSGSTCCVCLLLSGRRIVNANVGDSLAVVGAVGDRGRVTARELNREHKPSDPQEAARVLSHGGRIAPYCFNGQLVGPERVWLKAQDLPGLCMTRAFGDEVAARVGVTCEPECTTTVLQPQDRYLVVCSDGITEFITSQEIVEMLHGSEGPRFGPKEACQMLLTEARKRWAREEGDVVDDCTVIVAFLSVQPL